MSPAKKDGTSTPRASAQTKTDASDSLRIMELIQSMSGTLTDIDKGYGTLNEQTAKIPALGPNVDELSQSLQELREKLYQHGKQQDAQIKGIKESMRSDIKNEALDKMREQIREQVKKEIIAQVKEEVDVQILEHIPIPLRQQVEDSKQQMGEVRASLANSRARAQNSSICATNQDEPFAPVLKPNGEESKLFPADLRSLFDYNLNDAKALVMDFDLQEDNVLEVNLNRFMSYIGVPFKLEVSKE